MLLGSRSPGPRSALIARVGREGRDAVCAARAAVAATLRAARAAEGPGTVSLGIDERGREVRLSDREVAAHGLIVGASGAGKSTTLLAILGDRIARGLPVIAIDLKGSPAFAAELRARPKAAQDGRSGCGRSTARAAGTHSDTAIRPS